MNSETSTPSVFAKQLEGMGAESGFSEEETTAPIRGTGLVSLLLGLVSWVGLVGIGALVVPALAVLFGLIANRPTDQRGALWTGVGKVGLSLGLVFGIAGILVPTLKTRTLGGQALKCTRHYIELVHSDYQELAIELTKRPPDRFDKSMSLREFYLQDSGNEEIKQKYFAEGGPALILSEGPDAQWELDRPVRIFHKYGKEKADIVWMNKNSGKRLQFYLEYHTDQSDVGQWFIERVAPYRERIIAQAS